MIKKVFEYKFSRFVVVGGTAFIIDFSLYKLIVFLLHIYPPFESAIANFFSVTVAFIYNFTLSRSWTFEATGKKAKTQLIKFFIINLINLGISTLSVAGLVWIFKHTSLKELELSDSIIQAGSKIFVTGVLMFWNFTIYKFWIFKEQRNG